MSKVRDFQRYNLILRSNHKNPVENINAISGYIESIKLFFDAEILNVGKNSFIDQLYGNIEFALDKLEGYSPKKVEEISPSVVKESQNNLEERVIRNDQTAQKAQRKVKKAQRKAERADKKNKKVQKITQDESSNYSQVYSRLQEMASSYRLKKHSNSLEQYSKLLSDYSQLDRISNPALIESNIDNIITFTDSLSKEPQQNRNDLIRLIDGLKEVYAKFKDISPDASIPPSLKNKIYQYETALGHYDKSEVNVYQTISN